MKPYLWILLALPILMGLMTSSALAQSESTPQNNSNPDTTAAVANLTNASSSVEDAKNMSAIQGTMNQTGP